MNQLKTDDLIRLAEKTGLKPAELKKVLLILAQEGPIENNQLVRKTGLAKSILKDLKQNLAFLLEKPSRSTALTQSGKKAIENLVAESPKSLEEVSRQFKKILRRYQKERPLPKRKLDQFWATEETVVKRVSLMLEQGDLEGRNLLFLGDSDLTSLAAALTSQARSIQVVDLDKDVLRFLTFVSTKEKLKINCLGYDARKKLPAQLKAKFDLVFTDPPYTPDGFKLFLSRGIEALRPRNTSVIYFCYGHSRRSNERELKIQTLIAKAGLLIHLKLPAFNFYFGAESIGSTSSIYIGEITPRSKPLVKSDFSARIYSG